MTVTSLWKALDRAGCGRAIGADDLLDHHGIRKKTNPWNVNQRPNFQRPTLAVDLSIWICEAMTSSGIAENHSDPTLHLVFTRTVKLLDLGVKLVGVLDGKRRLRHEGEHNGFEKRRSGTPFARACERCEDLYNRLGVPIVRAKVEGEALCALLNQKGVVDGIISNDGDCFLFGATTLYTKFSIENLRQGNVMRYDAENLAACLDDDDSDAVLTRLQKRGGGASADRVNLTRSDLIAFAILTGSDVAGGGFPKVGCRKALRFIRKCQIDSPLRSSTAAIDEMISWAASSKCRLPTCLPTLDCPDGTKKCSICFHFGTKSSHIKDGCMICGTGPGEPCFQSSSGDRFRKSLRAKALALVPAFDPASVYDVYQSPNENQMPLCFFGLVSKDVAMKRPDLDSLLGNTFIIRGKSYAESRKYVLQSISRLLAKLELSSHYEFTGTQSNWHATKERPPNRNKPIPIKLMKFTSRSSIPCYEVHWKIQATITDSEGNPIDDFEFVTIEEQETVNKSYPSLVQAFLVIEKEILKQGRAEQEKRQSFLDQMAKKKAYRATGNKMQSTVVDKPSKSHRDFFAHKIPVRMNAVGGVSNPKGSEYVKNISQRPKGMGDDVAKLLETSAVPRNFMTIESDSIQTSPSDLSIETCILNSTTSVIRFTTTSESPYKFSLTPSHVHFLSISGSVTQRSRNEVEGGCSEKPVGEEVAVNILACLPECVRVRSDATSQVTGAYHQSLPSRQRSSVEQTRDSNEMPLVPRCTWHRPSTATQIDTSPYLKRAKPSFGVQGTPSPSRNRPVSVPGLSPTNRGFSFAPSLFPHHEEPQWTIGDQLYEADYNWSHDSPYLADHRETFGRPNFRDNGFESGCPHIRPFLSPDVLDASLLGSFADISIHTIPSVSSPKPCSGHRQSQSRNHHADTHSWGAIDRDGRLRHNIRDRDGKGSCLQPTCSLVATSLDMRFHQIMKDDGVVNVALANLADKTRAAEMHQLHDTLMRETMWQDQMG
jgi:XPG I-region/Chromatin organization modifier domain 2/XPG N-terminal domain